MVRRVIRLSLGSFFILLGLAGLVLPILQGWLFLGLGALVLSRDVPFLSRIVNAIAGRFPRVGLAVQRLSKILPAMGN